MTQQLSTETRQSMLAAMTRLETAKQKLKTWERLMGDGRDTQMANIVAWTKQHGAKLNTLIDAIKADRDEASAAWDAMVAAWTTPEVVEAAGVLAYRPQSDEHPVTGGSYPFAQWWSECYASIVAVNAARAAAKGR